MLLSHCPNCQHDNKPGERFCAACGVPLDLKPCPVCGKVDNIKATVCTGCGAHFPPVAASPSALGPPTIPHETERPIPPVVSPPPNTIRAFPLIIIALAAGGIPLLWLFRNTMPVPKAWQATPPAIEIPVAPPQPIRPRPEPVPEPAPVPTPAPAPVLIPLPVKPVEPEPPVVRVEPATAAPAPKPVAKPKPKPAAAPVRPARPDAATTCTEALAAVGLCERKAAKE